MSRYFVLGLGTPLLLTSGRSVSQAYLRGLSPYLQHAILDTMIARGVCVSTYSNLIPQPVGKLLDGEEVLVSHLMDETHPYRPDKRD